MQVIQIELRHNKDGRVGKTGWEWMVLLLGLCRGTNDIIFECMNEFFWRKREVLDVGMISVHDAAPFFFPGCLLFVLERPKTIQRAILTNIK